MAFKFKTVTDYTPIARAREAQTASTNAAIKDTMKSVTGMIVERGIAKKYPDDPGGIEANRERARSYAGSDPARAALARQAINDSLTQKRLDFDQDYKERTEQRAIKASETAVKQDERDFGFKMKKFEFEKKEKTAARETRQAKHELAIEKIQGQFANKQITQETAKKKLSLAVQKNIRLEFEDVAEELTPFGMGKSPNYFKALKALKALPEFQDGSLTNIPVEILEMLSPTVTSSGEEASKALFN
tara:strand:- start:1904 stop:2641 length:738 start_codon:yes stop_codon:yes gene_type:complete